MLRLKNKKAQSTAEYVILIGLVIGAVVAMQTYVKRGLQGRIKDAVDEGGGTKQYEPYYLSSFFDTNQKTNTSENLLSGGSTNKELDEDQSRTGNQVISDTSTAN